MILNVKLDGIQADIVNYLVKKGAVGSKSEAIRLMIMHYNEHFRIRPISESDEVELVTKKIAHIEKQVKEGKRKVLSEEEVLKKYPEFRDV